MKNNEIQYLFQSLTPKQQEVFLSDRTAFYLTPFCGKLPPKFELYRFFCGTVCNEVQLGVKAGFYCNLFFSKAIENYTIGDIVTICDASERATFINYSQAFASASPQVLISEWVLFRVAMEELTETINSLIVPEMDRIIKRAAITQTFDTNQYKKNKQIILPTT